MFHHFIVLDHHLKNLRVLKLLHRGLYSTKRKRMAYSLAAEANRPELMEEVKLYRLENKSSL